MTDSLRTALDERRIDVVAKAGQVLADWDTLGPQLRPPRGTAIHGSMAALRRAHEEYEVQRGGVEAERTS